MTGLRYCKCLEGYIFQISILEIVHDADAHGSELRAWFRFKFISSFFQQSVALHVETCYVLQGLHEAGSLVLGKVEACATKGCKQWLVAAACMRPYT